MLNPGSLLAHRPLMFLSAIILAIISFLSGLGWMLDRKKHRQEVESLKADNRQKDMNLSKMYVDEFNLNIVVPLQQRVQKLESQIERLQDAIEGINSCPYRAECPVLDRMRKQPEGD